MVGIIFVHILRFFPSSNDMFFLGKPYGEPKLQKMLHSLCKQQLGKDPNL